MRQIYESRQNDCRYNTSYPLSPSDWKPFETYGQLPFSDLDICFYIHIPFCERLCSFCEYTRMRIPDESAQLQYISILRRDMDDFLATHPHIILHGFDIGGGTPTSLCDRAFEELLKLYVNIISRVEIAPDFEPSIEATTRTLSNEKLRMIAENNIPRLSMGMQTTDSKILDAVNRTTTDFNCIYAAIETMEKVNLDLMYGLLGQSIEKAKNDIAVIRLIRPAQVTIYEYRTNQLCDKRQLDADARYDIYCQFFNALTSMGYHARFGQNTFSLVPSDFGVSSYLRNRMLNGMAYKGFGLSSQSMSNIGLSYNIGKNSNNLSDLLLLDSFESTSYYKLPPTELLAKFISISAYSGGFSIGRASEILGSDFIAVYSNVIDFLKSDELITIDGDRLQVTPKGFRHYGAIFSLFTIENLNYGSDV